MLCGSQDSHCFHGIYILEVGADMKPLIVIRFDECLEKRHTGHKGTHGNAGGDGAHQPLYPGD